MTDLITLTLAASHRVFCLSCLQFLTEMSNKANRVSGSRNVRSVCSLHLYSGGLTTRLTSCSPRPISSKGGGIPENA